MKPDEGAVERTYALMRAGWTAPVSTAPPVWTPIAADTAVIELRTPTLPPAAHTACYVVGTGPTVVLVDPGSPYPDQQAYLLEIINERGIDVVAVVLTHHHADHIGGAATWVARGVPVWAHPATVARLPPDVPVDRLLDDGDQAQIGAIEVAFVHTPGHAPGHLCVRVPSGGLVCGDMVAGIGTILIDPDGGDLDAYVASLARMRELAPRWLAPAHGGLIADADDRLRATIAHRRMREAKVIAALGPVARDLEALLAEVYADTVTAVWPLARRSLLAHLAALVARGVARPSAMGWARAPT